MSRQIQMRRGTTAQHANFTGAVGEVTVDTDRKTLRVHDGITPSGVELLNATTGAEDFITRDVANITDTGKDSISGMSMPASHFVDLTLGESGTQYVAPANGFFNLAKYGSAGQYVYMGASGKLARQQWLGDNGFLQVDLPCKKGTVINVSYTANGNIAFFRFIYAQGAQ